METVWQLLGGYVGLVVLAINGMVRRFREMWRTLGREA
jgi:hypothetical protein